MKFGLDQEQWRLVNDLVIRPLKSQGASVYIFGSRARGDHQKFSDLDVLVEFPTEESLSPLGRIRSAVEDSNLTIKVDIVDMADLAESFRKNVLKDRVEV